MNDKQDLDKSEAIIASEETLSEEEKIKIDLAINQAAAATIILSSSYEQLYKIMVSNGKKRTKEGQTFEDLI